MLKNAKILDKNVDFLQKYFIYVNQNFTELKTYKCR